MAGKGREARRKRSEAKQKRLRKYLDELGKSRVQPNYVIFEGELIELAKNDRDPFGFPKQQLAPGHSTLNGIKLHHLEGI